MSDTTSRKLFVNLAVRDLKRSRDFFSTLGFQFNPKFTDENAACMIVSGEAYVMLLAEPYFRTFTKRTPCDTTTHTEGMFAITCATRAEVDQLVEKALGAGGQRATEPTDHGFMYVATFYDPDGHHWELFWMDPKAAE